MKPINTYNGSALAYIGDAVYEVAIRKHLLDLGDTQANRLHKQAIKYVEAQGQADIMQFWLGQESFLSQDEIDFYRRGRNHKANTKAKNASIGAYRQATGFEALIGWLFLSQQEVRLKELISNAIAFIDEREEKK